MHPSHHDSLNNRLFCVDAQARQMTSTSTTASCRVLALLVLLRDLRDLESCFIRVLVSHNSLPKQNLHVSIYEEVGFAYWAGGSV